MKTTKDELAALEVAIGAADRNCTIELAGVPIDLFAEACQIVEAGFERELEVELAKLAELPAFAKAQHLQERRSEAVRKLDGLESRVAAIKAACVDALDEEGGIASAADEIEECRRAITMTRLAVETIDRTLPDVVIARDEAVRAAVPDIVASAREKASQAAEKAGRQFWTRAGKEIVGMLAARLQIDVVNNHQAIDAQSVGRIAEKLGTLS